MFTRTMFSINGSHGQMSFVRSVEALTPQHGTADITDAHAQATRPRGHKKSRRWKSMELHLSCGYLSSIEVPHVERPSHVPMLNYGEWLKFLAARRRVSESFSHNTDMRHCCQPLQEPTSHQRSDDARGASLRHLHSVVTKTQHSSDVLPWMNPMGSTVTFLTGCRLDGLIPPAVETIELQAER